MKSKNSKSLSANVFGTLKRARLQAGRQRSTHYGLSNAGRKVQTEFLADIAAPDTTDAVADDVERARRREIVADHIREFSAVPKAIKLIERRLFLGECIATVADELGLNQASARCLVARAKRYLGLSK